MEIFAGFFGDYGGIWGGFSVYSSGIFCEQGWAWYNREMTEKTKLADLETYVYIDVSNIRLACQKTLGWDVDFYKLRKYFRDKYANLQEVRYYEGLAVGDLEKKKELGRLRRAGYEICSLARKAYSEPAVYRRVRCRRCGHTWDAKVMSSTLKKKSNVDVYLASDMLTRALTSRKRMHIILVSCDGDYAEAIRNLLNANPRIQVSVLATPPVKDLKKNTLSVRLKQLRRELDGYRLMDISNFADYIRKIQVLLVGLRAQKWERYRSGTPEVEAIQPLCLYYSKVWRKGQEVLRGLGCSGREDRKLTKRQEGSVRF